MSEPSAEVSEAPKSRRPVDVLIAIAAVGLAAGGAWMFFPKSPKNTTTSTEFLNEAAREYGGHRYLLIRLPMTQAEASSYCRNLGGHLVAIGDESENQWLHETFGGEMAEREMNAWTGASDAIVEGKWIWEDGSPADFQNWARSGPNNRGDEDGAVMVSTSERWNDAPTTRKWWFFCEWDRWPPRVATNLDVTPLKESLGLTP